MGEVTDQSQRQVAALPYVTADGAIKVCMITSRTSGRWIIPKGWPEAGLSDASAAEHEAFEEAGLRGEITSAAIGAYDDIKRTDNACIACRVQVFALFVTFQYLEWPEKGQRKVRWMDPASAAAKVRNGQLAALLSHFSPDNAESRQRQTMIAQATATAGSVRRSMR